MLSQNDNNGQLSSVKNNYNKNNFTQNHSNGSVSKQQNSDVINHHHVSEALENGITGIKKEKEEERSIIEINSNNLVKLEAENELKIEQRSCDDDDDDSDNEKLSVKKINNCKRTNRKRDKKLVCLTNSSRVSSSRKNVIVEPICEIPRHAPLVQQKLNVIDKRLLLQNYRFCGNESRDERLSMRKMQLRHVLNQYKGINRLRDVSIERYKAQLSKSFKLSKVMEREKQRM